VSVAVLKSVFGWPTGTYHGTEIYYQLTHRYPSRRLNLLSGDPLVLLVVLISALRWPTGTSYGTDIFSQVTHPCFWQYRNLFSGDLPVLFTVLTIYSEVTLGCLSRCWNRWPTGDPHGSQSVKNAWSFHPHTFVWHGTSLSTREKLFIYYLFIFYLTALSVAHIASNERMMDEWWIRKWKCESKLSSPYWKYIRDCFTLFNLL
jgi:hypothetical protein